MEKYGLEHNGIIPSGAILTKHQTYGKISQNYSWEMEILINLLLVVWVCLLKMGAESVFRMKNGWMVVYLRVSSCKFLYWKSKRRVKLMILRNRLTISGFGKLTLDKMFLNGKTSNRKL